MFDPRDWYWQVGSNVSNVYSSKRNAYINPMSDPEFGNWKDRNGMPAAVPIPNEQELWYYMQHIVPQWQYIASNGTFAQPSPDTYHPEQLANYSEKRRFEVENGGMTTHGVAIRTDERAKQIVGMARDTAQTTPAVTVTLVDTYNVPHQFNAATVIEVSNDLNTFVFSTFTVFGQVYDQINSNAITTLAQIDAAYAAVPNTF